MKLVGIVAGIASAAILAAVLWHATRESRTDASAPTQSSAAKLHSPAPPEIDFADVDPAIVKIVRAAQTEVKINPHSSLAWGRLGMVLLAHAFDDAAAEAFTQAAQLDPKEPRWAYLHARSIIRLRPDDALPLLKKAADLAGTENLGPRLRLFELYLELDRPDEIEQPLKEFLTKHADNARARVAMARLALRRGDLDQCNAELQQVGDDASAQKAVHELRAEMFQRQGNRTAAESERRLAASTPAVAWPDAVQAEVGRMQVGLKVLLSRADRLFTAERIDESKALTRQIVQQYPDSEWAWILLSRAQIKLRQLNDAEESLDKALELNPESTDARFRKGVIYSLRALPTQAIEFFKEVVAEKPDHTVAHYNLGRCYEQTKEPALAEKHYRKAIEYQTDYYEPQVMLAELVGRNGKKQEAIELLKRALEIRPDDDYAKRKLAEFSASDEETSGESE